MLIYTEFMFVLFNLASLSTVIATMIMIGQASITPISLKMIYVFIILLHCILAGSDYFVYFIYLHESIFPERFLFRWRQLIPLHVPVGLHTGTLNSFGIH
jgi:hypothetical protein